MPELAKIAASEAQFSQLLRQEDMRSERKREVREISTMVKAHMCKRM